MDMNFKEVIEHGLSKLNLKTLKEGERKPVEGFLYGQYRFV